MMVATLRFLAQLELEVTGAFSWLERLSSPQARHVLSNLPNCSHIGVLWSESKDPNLHRSLTDYRHLVLATLLPVSSVYLFSATMFGMSHTNIAHGCRNDTYMYDSVRRHFIVQVCVQISVSIFMVCVAIDIDPSLLPQKALEFAVFSRNRWADHCSNQIGLHQAGVSYKYAVAVFNQLQLQDGEVAREGVLDDAVLARMDEVGWGGNDARAGSQGSQPAVNAGEDAAATGDGPLKYESRK